MSATKIQPPGLDDRFCPACGGRDLEFMTVEELKAEDDGFDPDSCFIAEGKVAWRCNGCGFGSDPGTDGGIPTLRHLIQGDWWSEDVNIAQLVRWAVEAMRGERQGARRREVEADIAREADEALELTRKCVARQELSEEQAGRICAFLERVKSPTTGSLPSVSDSTTPQQDFAPETPTLSRVFGVDRQGPEEVP